MALVGLAGFALALALVEQIVLETNLANVSRGSRVHESNHVSQPRGWTRSLSLTCPDLGPGPSPRRALHAAATSSLNTLTC